MTSKQLINQLCYEYNTKNYNEEKLKTIQKIKKDLEILDILKKHYDNSSLALSLNSFIVFSIHNDDKDFNKVKEWLENGKTN